MLKEIVIEMERAAKAFDLNDIDTAALCCRKACEGHIKMRAPEASPDPAATDPGSEFQKAVAALEIKDFSLAALCLNKATEGIGASLPDELRQCLERTADGIRQENFSTVANNIRDAIDMAVGLRPVEPVQVTL